MTKCFSFTESRNSCYRSTFTRSGLRSSITDLQDGTVMHCWVPKIRVDSKPNLLLIHGLGANALWQWGGIIRHLTPFFNVYVPDLLFFGGSSTTRPDRSESFHAQCVMRVMEANSVRRLSLVGLSYGGFVGYSMAAQYGEVVERVVLCCSGVCMEEKDLKEGLFPVSDLEEAASILVPQTPEKLRQLMGDYVEERRELIRAIAKDRKLSNLPKISQPTLIIWGEHDQVFPLELGHRLKRHLGDHAQIVVIGNAGHAFNVEKTKEFYRLLKSFLVDLQLPAESSSPR